MSEDTKLERELTASDVRGYLDWFHAMGMATDMGDTPCDWYAGPPAPLVKSDPAKGAMTTRGVSEIGRPVDVRPAPGQAPLAGTMPPGAAPSGSAPPGPSMRAAGASRHVEPSNGDAIAAARDAARSARTLGELHARLADFEGCGLKRTANALCFYRGAADARVMVVGEAPGEKEDKAGQPFVGPAGQLLDRMLGAIGLTEADCHITNIVYWRPPRNRAPSLEEVEVCAPFLERQIELVAPDVLLVLGKPASQRMFQASEGILKLRGKWRTYEAGEHKAHAIASLHPAFLLRQPGYKRQAWQDMLALRSALDGRSAGA